MKKIFGISLTGIVTFLILGGCEKVVDIDLNEADPKYVIEGRIMPGSGNNIITMTRSGSYYESPELDFVEGAAVVVTDNLGSAFAFSEVQPGMYSDAGLDGTPGRTYRLEINVPDEQFTAFSQMPTLVKIDSLSYQERVGFGRGGENSYVVRCHYSDPPNVKNYYKIEVSRGIWPERGFYVYDDDLNDGRETHIPLFQIPAQMGDSLIVKLLSIDEANYIYFSALTRQRGFGGSSVAPGNPQSNIKADVLGYFGAYSIDSATVVIK